MTPTDNEKSAGSSDSQASAANFSWLTKAPDRLRQQLEFLLAIDQLKSIYRASRIATGERFENSAEHSWHLAMFARILAEHANEAIDIERVVAMLMIHDIVEIDAGDVPLHAKHNIDIEAKELAAADRLFGLLPDDQGKLLRECWDEFEAATSHDAKFAKAVDRLQPILLNALNEGGTWPDYNVSLHDAKTRCAQISTGSDTLWTLANDIFTEAVQNGWLKTTPPTD